MSMGDDEFGTTEPSEWLRKRYWFLYPAPLPAMERPDPHCAFAHLHLIQQQPCEGCGWDGYDRRPSRPMRKMSAWQRLRGRWRLRRGYCPECNSSPPQSDCPICLGSRDYGPNSSELHALLMRQRWRAALEWEQR